MKNYIIVKISLLLLLGFTFAGCTEDVDLTNEAYRQFSFVVQMPETNHPTRIGMQQKGNSKDFSVFWQEGDEVQLVFYQDGIAHDGGTVKVKDISEDRKSAVISTDLPPGIMIKNPYDVYGFYGFQAHTDDSEAPYVTLDMTRSDIRGFKVPMYFSSVSSSPSLSPSELTMQFHHFGTYEALHIKNASNEVISFQHRGFDVSSPALPWYRARAFVSFAEGYNPMQFSGEWEGDAESGEFSIHPGDEEVVMSWYLPSGYKMEDAKLVAGINGQVVASANTKSSPIVFEVGHAYHMYATWDGSELKFTKNGVDDEDAFRLSSDELEVYVNDLGSIDIINGSGEYEVVNENPDIVEYDINGIHVAHGRLCSDATEGRPHKGDSWNITGKKIGSATLRLTDKQIRETLTLRVNVVQAPPLQLEKYTVELRVGAFETVDLLSGSGWYEITNSNPAVASADKIQSGSIGGGVELSREKDYGSGGEWNSASVSTDYDCVMIKALSVGSTVITVKDMSSGETATITVTVTGDTPSYTSCPDDHHPHMIDLGLPRGTKWACCNVGADAPEAYGGYYAWGETETKDYYDWNTYKWCSAYLGTEWDEWQEAYVNCWKIERLTKYNSDTKYGPVDNKSVLDPQDDVAHVKWGGKWSMPTIEEFRELADNCTSEVTMLNGVKGRKLTGPNGNSIFLPLAGRYSHDYLSGDCSFGQYWSSCNSQELGYMLLFYESGMLQTWDLTARCSGQSVRPVVSNSSYPCLDEHHPHMIDLGLPSGTKWACCNVGADAPEAYGGYYAWGETEEKEVYDWNSYKWCNGSDNSLTKYCTIASYGIVDNKTVLAPEYDVAHVKWGGAWRMPTLDEENELLNHCTSEWTTVHGVNGQLFIGPNGGAIFLPNAGFRWDSGFDEQSGHYWSSTLNERSPSYAHKLYFGPDYVYCYNYGSRSNGQSVRPVQ